MKYLGIDWGEEKIGVAIGSDETKIASPIDILKFKSLADLNKQLATIIIQENIDELIVGNPLYLSGHQKEDKYYSKFLESLAKIGKKIHLEDERMTTKLANVYERDFGKKIADRDDDLAAAIILQGFLDKL